MTKYFREAPSNARYKGAPLYYKGRDGQLRVWEIWSVGNLVTTNYGIVGGKMQTNRRACKGKGKGKAKTTPIQQADKEAAAKHKHNLDRKYSPTPEGASLPLELPMLADKFYDKEFNITPKGVKLMAKLWDTQPKIDGARGLSRWDGDDIVLISRSGKLWKGMEHITEPLKKMLPRDWEADGELYLHGIPLQVIMSWLPKENAKKFKPERLRLEYWIFDVPVVDGDETLTWYNRRAYLKPPNGDPQLYSADAPMIKLVPYKQCDSIEEFYKRETKIISRGFEGVMLRGHDGLYDYGRRSPALLKAKRFEDDEYEIIGFKDGEGRFEGAVVFNCRADNGEEFEVVPRGSMESRRSLYQNGDKLIGEKLTVRHQGFTEAGKPFIPVGLPNAVVLRHSFDLEK